MAEHRFRKICQLLRLQVGHAMNLPLEPLIAVLQFFVVTAVYVHINRTFGTQGLENFVGDFQHRNLSLVHQFVQGVHVSELIRIFIKIDVKPSVVNRNLEFLVLQPILQS